jgi:hypothetical protein
LPAILAPVCLPARTRTHTLTDTRAKKYVARSAVEMLPPYIPSAAEVADPALYASNVRKLMAGALGVPLIDQDRSHFLALVNAGVQVSWDGRRVTAPPGLLDAQGRFDIRPFMPGVFVAPQRSDSRKTA